MLDIVFVAFDILSKGTYDVGYSWSFGVSLEDRYLNIIFENFGECLIGPSPIEVKDLGRLIVPSSTEVEDLG